ncbi:MAG: YdgA family protein, partial [Chromatiales bacterium]|nr:YdgA family protein [Chromatiales bacterium]
MRRIIQLMLLSLALVCLAPAAIGRLAESRQQFLIDSLADNIAGADLITDQYETGWITSRSIHRLRLDDPAYVNAARELTGIPNLEESPELVIRSRIAHGPWPLLEGRPGLARVHSEVAFLVGQDEIAIPGVAITDIGLDASGVTVFQSSGVETTVESGSAFIRWHPTELRISFDRQVR